MTEEEERRENKITLSRWEAKILQSVRREGKSEKEIAKHVGLDVSTVSQLVTELMTKGFMERQMKKRRWRTSYDEYFTITPEGLAALEIVRGNNPLDNMSEFLDSLPIRVPEDAIRIAFRVARFILK